ncbi:hypothetical protein [Marinobacter xestospongiae]|uniref:Uncharacterized protein n=1 Tax=Marinobacter xestospongiae TaxID=994319 RepID=A0ABU3W1T7_9GAMM|nr:hypothetical protein [Marinobacter xestospongiae]MDV2080484.1 hypothetical protein [Marinobacter xestospongiae]
MFILLEKKQEISEAHATLKATVKKSFVKSDVRNIGYPGGTTYDAKVYTNGDYWFWSSKLKEETPNPRQLNWFGVYEPAGGLQISVEINTPFSGANQQVSGYFARNPDDGQVYLMHSGRVGGGTKGVGKSAFLAWSNHTLAPAMDSDGNQRFGVVVMPVNGVNATRSAIRYLESIVEFKKAVRNGEISTVDFQRKLSVFEDYYAESFGRRKGRRKSNIDYLSRHGEVVEALKSWREQKRLDGKSRFVKNVQIDLGLEVGGVLSELYEVKTSSSRSDMYTAIGQLVVHSCGSSTQRYLVLPSPAKIPLDVEASLNELKIQVIQYELTKDEVHIK